MEPKLCRVQSSYRQTIYLNYRPFIVVGVCLPEFLGTPSSFRPDVWIPIQPFRDRYVSWTARAVQRDVPLVRVYARLVDGVTPQRAFSELAGIARGLDETYPRQDEPRRLRLEKATWIDPASRLGEMPTIRLMVIAVTILLLLVCANTSNLLLALARGREREINVRAVLGASPAGLLRLVLIETTLIAGTAGVISLLLAGPASSRLGSYFARPSVWGENVARIASVDGRVLLWSFLATALAGLLIGSLPAWRSSRRNLMGTLRSSGTGAGTQPKTLFGWRLPELQSALVASQVTLTVVLLVVAGLVLRTLIFVNQLDPGFDYDRLIVTHISTSSTDLTPEQRDLFFRDMARELSQEPWIESATIADYPLLSPHPSTPMRLEGQSEEATLVYSKVIPGFFEALGIEVLHGREFGPRDLQGGQDVAMVNQLLADRYFPKDRATGRKIWWPGMDGAEREFEIVGVVANTKIREFLSEPEPTVYFSYPQHRYPTGSAFIVSTRQDVTTSLTPLFQWLRAFEPHLAIVNVISYPDVVRGFLYTHRMNAELFSALGFLGIALAASGIFSVIALAVGRRRREISIRMSLGAQRRQIGSLMLRQGMLPVLTGVVVGLLISLPVARLTGTLLQGVSPSDPLTLFLGTGVIVLAALLAAVFPTVRATHIDPVRALRQE